MKVHEAKYGGDPANFSVEKRGDELVVELVYPPWSDNDNEHGRCRHIRVDQESVRASDGIRMHYDYDRDGWSIEQPRQLMWDCADDICDMRWVEVAFIQSWTRNEDPD